MNDGAAGGRGGRGRGRKEKRRKHQHAHPGGSGAVLGVRLIRYSGVQGTSLVISNLLQLAVIVVIAHFLGPSDLGRYGLLFFLGALITQVFVVLSKPGTIRRTFGADDDEDADEDEQEGVASESPERTLGTGLIWAAFLGVVGAAAVIALRRPIADLLLGDPEADELVLWAGMLGGAGVLFRLATITLWFERRPGAFLLAEAARPALGLVAITAALAAGAELEGVIAGAAAGTALAALGGVVLLRGSFEPSFDLREAGRIAAQARFRAPIVMSFWLIQNADIFVLSRFVDHSDLGLYTLASRLGFVASFLPQGFRVALRPLRRSASFQAVRDQYGKGTASGQLLGYFTLLCITAVLVMVLGGELLVKVAPDSFGDAAPLIPFTAAAMVMPTLYRMVQQNTSWPSKRRLTFILGCVGAAITFFVSASLLAGPAGIGIYAAPVAMLTAFALPSTYFFLRCQLSKERIDFPYVEVLEALVMAAAIAVGFHLLPELNQWLELAIAAVLMGLFLVLLFVARVIPESHWPALAHMARSVVKGRADRFNPRAGLRALETAERAELRVAVTERIPPERLAAASAADGDAADNSEPARLVGILRRAGEEGGLPVGEPSKHDALIARFLFARAPTAARMVTMRRLLSEGADSNDLRALEDLVGHLARIPDDAWTGKPKRGRRGNRGLKPA